MMRKMSTRWAKHAGKKVPDFALVGVRLAAPSSN
eukprot:CAMPEP_0183562720 /NCGR_PEP_ID=MMETSP0371-20130417/98720_1 /TAXON_ID=268820 /ORGANISM="Peridinium aciculiferum, Strain PAER-2" /LENGTH=33 /DNA_ID= /DNA_START= /DNA_END= /DNA_ORIENTATION=